MSFLPQKLNLYDFFHKTKSKNQKQKKQNFFTIVQKCFKIFCNFFSTSSVRKKKLLEIDACTHAALLIIMASCSVWVEPRCLLFHAWRSVPRDRTTFLSAEESGTPASFRSRLFVPLVVMRLPGCLRAADLLNGELACSDSLCCEKG